MERLLVQSLQFLTVLLFGVHLYLKCVHFQKLCSFLDIVHPFRRLAGLVELFDDFGQSREVTLVKTQLTQLREEEERLQGGTRKKEGKRMEKREKERGRITGGGQDRRRGGWGKGRRREGGLQGDKKGGGGGWGKRRRREREDYRGTRKEEGEDGERGEGERGRITGEQDTCRRRGRMGKEEK